MHVSDDDEWLDSMRLALGSAQFGLDYGISNTGGQTPPEEVARILRVAYEGGLQCIDTAHLYGSSEKVLGEALRQLDSELEGPYDDEEEAPLFLTVSKTPKFSASSLREADGKALVKACRQSLKALGGSQLYGLLVHDADDLLKPGSEYLYDALYELKDDGLVVNVGASVYDARQIDALMERLPLDLLQVPLSVFDQRLLHSGHLRALNGAGIEIHARSVFLQGVAFFSPDVLPAAVADLRPQVEALHQLAKKFQVSPALLALKFCLAQPEINQVICGVNTAAQLQNLVGWANHPGVAGLPPAWWETMAAKDEALINPARWES